jgi:hypothetical protein
MDKFIEGCGKFDLLPGLYPTKAAQEAFHQQSSADAIFRLFPVPDGVDLWQRVISQAKARLSNDGQFKMMPAVSQKG